MPTPDRETSRRPKPSMEEITNRFTYHPPRNHREIAEHQLVRSTLEEVAQALVGVTPASREQSLMLTHLEQAMMYANAALARNRPEPNYPPGEEE